MFVVLEINERREAGIFDRLLSTLTKSKTQLERAEIFGQQYAVLHVDPPRGEADWQRICEALGRYGRRTLLPAGICVPDYVPLASYRSKAFDTQVLFSTACAVISRTRMQMYRRLVGLVDPNGKYVDRLEGLLKYFTAVKVLTGRHDLYEQASADIMDTLGAPVILCDGAQGLRDCVLTLCPEEFICEEPVRLDGPVMGDSKARFAPGTDLISHLEVAPPADVLARIPSGILPHHFMGAVYELLGVRQMDLVAKHMRLNHKASDIGEVAGWLARQFEGRFAAIAHRAE